MRFLLTSCALLLLAAPAALGECATPDSSIACVLSYDPVTCNGCNYDNQCLADAAGQTGCAPSCAVPDASTACTSDYSPVACGGFTWCLYDNLCLALAAGKTEADCQRSCPALPEAAACTLEYDPYFCGGCIYDNSCLANAAWGGAGLSVDSCVAVGPIVGSSPTCPTIPDGTACTFDYVPQTCDGDCTYDNTCLAEAAGATGCSDTCGLPDETVACTLEYSPVVCGPGCFFSNSCLGEAAGYSDCSPVCPTPAEGTACTTEFAPIYCQGCEFDNECLASAAGFDVTTDCNSVTVSATLAASCPAIPGDVACTLDFNPVTCDGDCQYDNSCLAEAAGASNCVGSCPAPDTTVACPAVFAPVACGGTQWCLYDNLCTALAAGQEEIDCVRDCPTNTQEGVACTFEYDPVFCGGCIYPNSCEATAAWVTSAGLSESSCTVISTLPFFTNSCPTIPDAVACTADYNPQTCDGDCTYDNTCLAEAAGATGCTASCPLPDAEIACTREYAPVVCGGCTYSNACSGTAAGFTESDCSTVCPDSSTAGEGVACTLEYAPVFCQGCEFANECVAASLGFDVAVDCASIGTVQSSATDGPTDDPTSAGNGAKQLITTMVASFMFGALLI